MTQPTESMRKEMSNLKYECLNCGATSTPENRTPFITEYECVNCIGKVTGEKEISAKQHWHHIYSRLNIPTAANNPIESYKLTVLNGGTNSSAKFYENNPAKPRDT